MECEYRDREMWLEGTSDKKPFESDIIEHAKAKGFYLENIKIWFDTFQSFWRFNADLACCLENRSTHSALIDKITGLEKQVIRLDKNFHVYVHGDKTKIEEGVNEKGKFLKLYFNEAM